TGRPVDPGYPTNKAISIITIVVIIGGIIFKLSMGDAFWHSLGWGFGAGISVFLSWALCREIDPDHELSAFVAAGLTLVGVFFFYPPAFIGLVWLMLTLRIVNRTTGLKAYIQDSIILSLLSGWFTFQGYWIYGAITILAFLLDSLIEPRDKKQIYFALVNALILAVVWATRGFPATFAHYPLSYPVIPVLVIILFIPLMVSYRVVKSKGDDTGEELEPARIISAQILALFTGIQLILQSGYATMMPLYGAICGAAIYFYFALPAGKK
ncbi:MAG TPA: hypothetical protein VE870_04850, partial [Bacteroidales bacterium]|nr:hypothetical protein [Bacteroidales bacterium]